MSNYIQIGFTKKTHGIGGELKVVIEEPYEDIFLEADRVFLEIKGARQPFFIKNIRGGGDLIVLFEDVANREEALALQSRGIFLPENEVPEEAMLPVEDMTEYGYVVGFMLVDQEQGQIGPITEIIEMPQQEMAVVQWQGREVLIPLNEQFVLSVDEPGKTVRMNLPEGLLAL